MPDETKQPVVDATNGAAQPAPAAKNDAPDLESLDSLLKQFETETKATAAPAAPAAPVQPDKSKPEVKPDSNALADQVRKLVEHQENETKQKAAIETKKELDATVKTLRGDMPDNPVVDKFIRGWLKDMADSDPRLQDAFSNRFQNPQGWEKVKTALAKSCQKEFAEIQRRPDAAATEDREAVTASLRGASTTPPPAKEPNVGRMSDAELKKLARERYGYDPNF